MLIIAFIFLIVASLVVVTLSSWASNGLNNTSRFQTASNNLYAAEGATQVAMRAARYTYPTSSSEVCPGTPSPISIIPGTWVQVWCQTTTVFKNGSILRETTLTACQMMSAGSPLTTGPCITATGSVPQLLVAVVDFNDTSPIYTANCSSANESTCGAAMTVVSWESR